MESNGGIFIDMNMFNLIVISLGIFMIIVMNFENGCIVLVVVVVVDEIELLEVEIIMDDLEINCFLDSQEVVICIMVMVDGDLVV